MHVYTCVWVKLHIYPSVELCEVSPWSLVAVLTLEPVLPVLGPLSVKHEPFQVFCGLLEPFQGTSVHMRIRLRIRGPIGPSAYHKDKAD